MAVPGRRNGLMDDEEDDEGLFDEVEGEAWADLDRDVPPHLRALIDAAQRGNVDALRLALGTPPTISMSSILPMKSTFFYFLMS